MLKRFCDRCEAEMPMEQKTDESELVLRRLNKNPYSLCDKCQSDLNQWLARTPSIYLTKDGIDILTSGITKVKLPDAKTDIDDFGLHSSSITAGMITADEIRSCASKADKFKPTKGMARMELVVSCEDCQFYELHGQKCNALNASVAPDFWCKHGKRKQEGENAAD